MSCQLWLVCCRVLKLIWFQHGDTGGKFGCVVVVVVVVGEVVGEVDVSWV